MAVSFPLVTPREVGVQLDDCVMRGLKTRKLVADITQLQRRKEKMTLAEQQLEEKEKQQLN